jgi:CHAT domain-containing protein/tetratricopeptide (TPR) repeat protein
MEQMPRGTGVSMMIFHRVNRLTRQVLFLLVCSVVSVSAYASATTNFKSGIRAYESGNYSAAIKSFETLLGKGKEVQPQMRFDALLYQADALRILGQNQHAAEKLEHARDLLSSPELKSTAMQEILLSARLGVVEYARGNYTKAVEILEHTLSLMKSTPVDPAFKADIHTDLGTAYASVQRYPSALAAFDQAERYLPDASDTPKLATILLNKLKTQIDAGELKELEQTFDRAQATIDPLPVSTNKVDKLISLGEMYRLAKTRMSLSSEYTIKAYQRYRQGLRLAKTLNYPAGIGFAYGNLAKLYEEQARHKYAVMYSRKAAFYAQSRHSPESLYEWEWQIARNLHALNDIDGSLKVYQQAINTLREIRSNLESVTQNSYKQYVGPVFYQYADVMLKKASQLQEGEEKQQLLYRVRDILEEVKRAEVRDYFENECLPPTQSDKKLDDLSVRTAVLYPVLLKKRTELLLSLPDGMHQFTVPISRNALTQLVRDFRINIQTDLGTRDYLRHSQKLYGFLIKPLQDMLSKAKVETLVMIPEGPLRTIPMAALHDGKQYLVERYAIATTPGLTLTDPKPISEQKLSVMAGGISESVQGYIALPSVKHELSKIKDKTGAKIYIDEAFSLATVRTEVETGDFIVAHFATHGEFSNNYKQSYILTHDKKFALEQLSESISLRRLQSNALELLVLSACQTAAGDDRAALGLAGIAVKAGARSALASLWTINDEATAELIDLFYGGLIHHKESKAISLQQAQLALIQSKKFKHPTYWAPFLMIGNWL